MGGRGMDAAAVEAERSEPIAHARGHRDPAGKRPNEAIDLAP
tara:strand:+ start:1145644 stop:1145769 length:126 start_codon:yes stop_codon:yes gene_type:complete